MKIKNQRFKINKHNVLTLTKEYIVFYDQNSTSIYTQIFTNYMRNPIIITTEICRTGKLKEHLRSG